MALALGFRDVELKPLIPSTEVWDCGVSSRDNQELFSIFQTHAASSNGLDRLWLLHLRRRRGTVSTTARASALEGLEHWHLPLEVPIMTVEA